MPISKQYDFTKRPLSWSGISSFEYDPEQWYEKYVLGEKPSSKEMTFGSIVDKKIQDDPYFLPKVPRYPLMQFPLKATFNKIPMVGFPDGLDLENMKLADYKTGKAKWDQKRADETGQLTMYLFLLYIVKKVKPEEFKCYIHWLPTKENGDFSITLINENDVQTFETKRTMRDLLEFGARINTTVKAMNEYLQSHE
jgi:hypothetical protein